MSWDHQDDLNEVGHKLVSLMGIYGQELDRAARAIVPSPDGSRVCRAALDNYIAQTDGKGVPGGLGAFMPKLEAVIGAERLEQISCDVLEASKCFDRDFGHCARALAQCFDSLDFDDSRRILCEYLECTGGKGHPDGLEGWWSEVVDDDDD